MDTDSQRLREYYLSIGLEEYIDELGYYYFSLPQGIWYPDPEAREFYASFGDALNASESLRRQALVIPQELFETCNRVQQYIENQHTRTLVIGVMTCKQEDLERFVDPSFIFLDMRWGESQEECETSNRDIICDMNDPQQVEYLSGRFVNVFDRIITDLGVVKFFPKWTITELQCIYNMLKPGGVFITDTHTCAATSFIREIPQYDFQNNDFVNTSLDRDVSFFMYQPKGFAKYLDRINPDHPYLRKVCFTPEPRIIFPEEQRKQLAQEYRDIVDKHNTQHVIRLLSNVFGRDNIEIVDYNPNNILFDFTLRRSVQLLFCYKN
jgi:hypothetical protein